MKNYLKSSLILLILFNIFNQDVYGSESTIQYRRSLESWNIEADILIYDPILIESEDAVYKESSSSISLLSGEDIADFLLIKSSTLNRLIDKNVLNKYGSIIIICDEEFVQQRSFLCGYDKVEVKSENVLYTNLGKRINSGEDLNILSVRESGKLFVIIPEQYMVTPEYAHRVEVYFRTLGRSQGVQESIGYAAAEKESINLLSIIRSNEFELLYPVMGLLILAVLLRPLITTLILHPQKLYRKSTYQFLFTVFIHYFRAIRPYAFIVFLALIMIYPLILYTISFKNAGALDLNYIATYLKETFDFTNIDNFIKNARYLRLGVSLLNMVTLITLIILLIPEIQNIFYRSVTKLCSLKLNENTYKIFAPLLLFTMLITSIIGNVEDTYSFLVLLMLLFLYITSIASRDNKNSNDLLYSRQKLGLFATILLIILSGSIFNEYSSRMPIELSREDLLGLDESVTLLPYSKLYGSNVVFDDFLINPEFRVFVENRLLYDPGYSEVRNVKAEDFSTHDNFIVFAYANSKYFATLARYNNLLDYVKTPTITNAFILGEEASREDAEYEIEFGILCYKEIDKYEVKIIKHTNVGKEAPVNMLKFPGCGTGESLLNYRVPTNLFGEEKFGLYEVDDFKDKSLAYIKVYRNGREAEVTYIKDPLVTPVLYEFLNSISSDILYAYSFDLDTGTVVKRAENGLNISNEVNILRQKDKLKNPFIIWSDTPNAVIKNGYIK